MFETGKTYEFRMLEGEDEVSFLALVQSYEHPLLKLTAPDEGGLQIVDAETDEILDDVGMSGGKEQIVNVTSPNFVSAILQG